MDIQKYIIECHANDAADIKKRFEANLLRPRNEFPLWTSAGRIGNFIWKSLTTVFAPENNHLSELQLLYDNFHYNCAQKGGLYMMSYLQHSIEVDPDLSFLLEDGFTLIANTDLLYPNERIKSLCIGMREYLRQNCTMNNSDAFYIDENNIKIISKNVEDQNVIIPIPYLWPNEIENLPIILDLLCKKGAKTVFLFAITRVMPNSQGETPQGLSKALTIPPITGMSFSELIDSFE